MGALGDGCFGGELECNGVGQVFMVDIGGEEEEEELVGGCGSGSESTAGIEDAVKVLLQGLGEDPDRDGLKRTPLRVAKAFRDGTRGYRQNVHDIVQGALFPEAGSNIGTGQAGGTGGLVLVRDIILFSYCESCLLPFKVQCHVGYVPSGQRVVGLSKLARVADVFAKRLQDPQRLADDVCSALQSSIKPAGVAVFLECWHIQIPEAVKNCPIQRHPSKSDMQGWIQAPSYSCSGVFEDESSNFWADFVALLKFRGVTMIKNHSKISPIQHRWCPLKSQEMPLCNGHNTIPTNIMFSSKSGATQVAMLAAVTSIITSLGEDPQRKELVGTPYRFVQWLMNFKRSSFELKMNGFNHGMADLYNKTRGDVGHDQSVIHSELNLPFCSQCEHHLLPFHGVVHIGYFGLQEPKPVDRSILQSIVHFYGSKLQVQERLTRQIAETVLSILHRGVMVVVEANHICMISRGIEKVGSSTATIAVLGQFAINIDAKETFLQAISDSTASGG